jgi:hypothetical protein
MIQAPDMKVMADAQWSILQILNSEKMFYFLFCRLQWNQRRWTKWITCCSGGNFINILHS